MKDEDELVNEEGRPRPPDWSMRNSNLGNEETASERTGSRGAAGTLDTNVCTCTEKERGESCEEDNSRHNKSETQTCTGVLHNLLISTAVSRVDASV